MQYPLAVRVIERLGHIQGRPRDEPPVAVIELPPALGRVARVRGRFRLGPGLPGGGRAGRFEDLRKGLASPQCPDDLVQPAAGDELHDVVVKPLLLADAEDRDDVRVVELGDGLGLAVEALHGPGVEERVAGEQLEARPCGRAIPGQPHRRSPCRPGRSRGRSGGRPAVRAAPGPILRRELEIGIARPRAAPVSLQLLHQRHRRQCRADLLGVLGMARGEVAHRGLLATAATGGELLRQQVDAVALRLRISIRVPIGIEVGHGRPRGGVAWRQVAAR